MKEKVIIDIGAISWNDIKTEYLPNTKSLIMGIRAKEVITCKDCKYWNKHHLVDIYVCSIHNKEGQYPYLLFEMSADDFCSKGEKKDDRP